MNQNAKKGLESHQILVALIALGLIGSLGLGAFAIHQKFQGRFGIKVKDWVEFGYEGISDASVP